MCQLQSWTLGLQYLVWISGRTLDTKNPYCCKKGEVLTKDSVRSYLSHHHFRKVNLAIYIFTCIWGKATVILKPRHSCRYPGAEVSCTFLWPWQHPQIPDRYHSVFATTEDLAGNSKETGHSVTPLTCKGSGMEDGSCIIHFCLPFTAWCGKKSVYRSVRLCTWLSGRYCLISKLPNGEELCHKNHENLNPICWSHRNC